MSGVGSVYKRGSYWWVQWFVRGKRYRASTQETSKPAALAKLGEKLKEAEPPAKGKLTFEDLCDAIRREYAVNGRRSARRLDISSKHLRAHFGNSPAAGITTARVRDYAFLRSESGAANGTINRELSALKRMLSLAVEDGRLAKAPRIKLLDEPSARQGFFEHEQFNAVVRHLPEHLKDPVTFLYLTGWRLEEMQSLEWRDVDLAHGVIRLRAEKSKNKEPRILRLAGELADVLARASEHRRLDCVYVLHRNGHQLRDFRAAWKTACRAAGVPGRLRHDFRRSAYRNMIRAGVPDVVARRITGHKTRSVADRYNIVSDSDLGEAQEKLTEYLGQQSQPTILKGPSQKQPQSR